MERVETVFIFTRACDKHLADISPGALVDDFMDADITVVFGIKACAVRRKTHALTTKPWNFPALIPVTNRDLFPDF